MIWALYILGGNVFSAGTVAAVTLLSWWYLSDYFIAPWWDGWKSWMDWSAFVLASAGLSALIAFGFGRWIRKQGLRPEQGTIVTSAPAGAWADMFQAEAEAKDPSSRKGFGSWWMNDFLRWRLRLLEAIDPNVPLDRAQVLSTRFLGFGGLVISWGRALWFPLLAGALLYVPHTSLMESLAAEVSSYRNVIFALRIRSEIAGDNGAPLIVEEDLSKDFGCYIRKKTARLDGELTVRATDFPRVYREIEANCPGEAPLCQWPSAEDRPPKPVALRGGLAKFRFFQTPGNLSLGMTVVLKTRQGTRLDYACIDSN